MKPKLLLVSSNMAHLMNYYHLVEEYFSEILVVTNTKIEHEDVHYELLDFSLIKLTNHFQIPRRIKGIVKKFKPDIVHVHQANAYSYYTIRALSGFHIPIVVTAWGSDILVAPKRGFLLKRMVQYVLKRGTAFTSDSVFMAEEMRRLSPSLKLNILIANFGIGIDPQQLPKENIIYSNRLHFPLYRIDQVIKSFNLFSKTDQGNYFKLIIAATGAETEELRTLVKTLGIEDKVEFAGWVNKEKNAEYYAKAKIYVSIPESDATAISLLEAMASECIPVVSDLPANKEWIKDQINGVVVSDIRQDFFSAALNLQAEKAIAINKKMIEENGTKVVNRMKFFELYDSLIK